MNQWLFEFLDSLIRFKESRKSGESNCREKERQALLNFKQSLTADYGRLSTWTDHQNNTDCCNWEGIQCNHQTGHVILLDLRCLDTHYLTGAINLTSLIPLQYIQHLDLSNNDFLLNHIPQAIGSFTNLQYLNLSFSAFSGRIPFQLGNLSLLKYLDLGTNSLLGSVPFQIGNLKQLQYLDLGGNNYLSGEIPFQLGNLKQLQYLDLGGNYLSGEIPLQLRNLKRLQYLNLASNTLSGAIPFRNGNLPHLQTLGLGGDFYVEAEDSQWLSNLHSLTSLELTSLHNLSSSRQWLQAIRNDIALSSFLFPNFPSLNILDLSWNNLTSSEFQGNFNFGSNLRKLRLQHCILTDKSFPISSASTINSSSSLVILDLSSNLLKSSTVFYWLLNCTSNLQTLSLSRNLLEGPLPDGFGKVMNSKISMPPVIDYKARFRLSLGTCADCRDLSNNHITGQIPDCWQPLHQLLFLDLRENKLSGNIPISMGKLVKLKVLVLRKNNLTGGLHSSLRNCTNLIMLDVSENNLSGRLPSWIGESMQQLRILNMKGNHFSSNLPIQLCYLRYIQLLDLSRNKLSKVIPTCLKNFTAMSEKSINRTETELLIYGYNITYSEIYGRYTPSNYRLEVTWMWKGVEQVFRDPQMKLKSIDLSCNDLSGEIPKEVACLVGLVSLNLSSNNLSGEIPFRIGNLSSLESLDLSRNHLHGRIPSSLSELDFLGKLDLSYNFLSGRIPLGRHLQTFGASSFEGNIDLCGEQVNKSCPGDHTTEKPEEAGGGDGDDSVFYEALYMSMGLGFFVGFWGLIGPILIWKPWRIAYLRFLNRLTTEIQL
ncbi:hypothetical protein V8G54_012509 [Vigna mungo]|uniref:Leucine-rich repeat-containing N-terminal plant-type domain-containing protein n=1 Tax=Vigna mungo TaxID=3915 RepID=A0AAQ3S3F4_VIGMU